MDTRKGAKESRSGHNDGDNGVEELWEPSECRVGEKWRVGGKHQEDWANS